MKMATRKKVNEQVAEIVEPAASMDLVHKIHAACALAKKMDAGLSVEQMAAELFEKLGMILIPRTMTCIKESGVNRVEMTFSLFNVDDPEEVIDFPTAGEGYGAPEKGMNKAIANAYNNLISLILMITPHGRREANEKIILEYYKDMKTILDYWKVSHISEASDEQVQMAADQIRERKKKDE
jgi:hypothetical protein